MLSKWLRILPFVGLFVAGICQAQTKTIHFTTDSEKPGGYLLAITQAAFERVGYKVEVDYRPWGRALEDVMTGQTEALLGAQFTEQRAEKMLYSQQIGQSEMVFFKLKANNVPFKQVADLKGMTVGTIRNASYTPEFDNMAEITKEVVTDARINVRKLLAGRIPLFVEKKAIIQSILKTEFAADADKIDFITPPLKTMKFFNCFSKAAPGADQKQADFNRGLEMITKDGTLQAILNRGLHE